MADPDPFDKRGLRPGEGFSLLSLYSGVGGMDDGFARAGFEPIWANDIDPVAVESYNESFGVSHAVAGPIEDLLCELPGSGEVDIVVGGPPCQGFSVAGRMDPGDPRSEHVWRFLGIVGNLMPRAFVMENVKSLAHNSRWADLLAALTAKATALGYRTETFVLNAADFGVPQARQRMFMVGIQDLHPVRPGPVGRVRTETVRDALLMLPPLGYEGNDQLCTAVVTPARNPVLRKSPYAGLLFNGKGRVLNLDAPSLTLPASMGGNRTHIIDQDCIEGGSPWIEDYHARLMDGREPLLEAPSRLRRLTVEEAAILQTFRKGWQFTGSQSARFRQIGNAVPPRLAYAVACSVGAQLAGSCSIAEVDPPALPLAV
jgi:DNA (cytosine-5)-methyltransferase 1